MISVFAIIILGVLGLLFNSNYEELVNGTEDPSNGPEVAGTIFIAVMIYTVRHSSLHRYTVSLYFARAPFADYLVFVGFLRILWPSGTPPPARIETRRHHLVDKAPGYGGVDFSQDWAFRA